MAIDKDTEPQFNLLAERSRKIFESFDELRNDPAGADWRGLKALADEASAIGDEMDAMIPR